MDTDARFDIPHDPYRALYLHIPFCVSRCAYCDFKTRACASDDPAVDAYVEDLALQLRRAGRAGELGSVETVYLGGGTPSHLGLSRLSLLLYTLSLSMHLTPEVECTMEANPESLTRRMINDVWALGVNRLSLGVQSFDDAVLRTLGRAHSADDARRAITEAQERFENISIDLMAGIPGQSGDSFAASVREAVALGIPHVSVYPLTIEEGTPFARAIEAGRMAAPDEDGEADAMEEAQRLLEQAGYHRYEVASYAKPGFESRHNTAYWTGVPYLGLGTGATTMTQVSGEAGARERRRITDGVEEDGLNAAETAAEDLMLGMRLARGVPDAQVAQANLILGANNPATATFQELARLGLVIHKDGRWRPTDCGWLCGNELYARLLDLGEQG